MVYILSMSMNSPISVLHYDEDVIEFISTCVYLMEHIQHSQVAFDQDNPDYPPHHAGDTDYLCVRDPDPVGHVKAFPGFIGDITHWREAVFSGQPVRAQKGKPACQCWLGTAASSRRE